MYVTHVDNVREYDVNIKGACKVRVKYLLHKGVGAGRIQFRLFTIDTGGYTPLEKHMHEHEVYVLKGRGLVKSGGREAIIEPGSVVFIPSFEEHQFINIGDEPLQFLCTKETSEIPEVLRGELG
ncbi:MAG: cupin domain-containing protein [Candidatus Methanomethylicia archaeon]